MAKVRFDARCGRYYLDYYVNGRRKREYPETPGKKAAEKALTARLAAIDAGTYGLSGPRPVAPTFGDFAEHYLRTYSIGAPEATWADRAWLPAWKASGHRPVKASWERDLTSLVHLGPAFGETRLDAITPADVEKYKLARLASLSKFDRPVAPASVKLELALLKHVFTKAISEGLVTVNPVKAIEMPTVENRRKRIVSPSEWPTLHRELAPHLKGPMTVALFIGSRIGAVLALRRKDVRFTGSGAEVTLTKTKRGKLHVVPVLGPALAVLREAAKNKLPEAWLFTYRGKPITRYRTAWNAACRRAGLTEPLHVHDLRRTAGTLMLEAGADLVTIRDVLGHTNVATTERYLAPVAHRITDALAGAAALMATGHEATQAKAAAGTGHIVDTSALDPVRLAVVASGN